MKKFFIAFIFAFFLWIPTKTFAYTNTWTHNGSYYLTGVSDGTMEVDDYSFSCPGHTPEVLEDWSNHTLFGTVDPDGGSNFILHLTTQMGYGSGLKLTDTSGSHTFFDCASPLIMTLVEPPPGPDVATSTIIGYGDWIITNSIIIFLLALSPFLTIFGTIALKKKQR